MKILLTGASGYIGSHLLPHPHTCMRYAEAIEQAINETDKSKTT